MRRIIDARCSSEKISNDIWPQPEGGSESYPGTSIRKSYHVSVDPLGKVFVPPAITRLFLDGLKDFAPDLPAEFRERSLSIEIGNVNSAIQDARFQLMRAERQGDPQPYYTATSWDGLSYDIAFAPDKEADGTVTVTAIRPRGRLTNWAQQAIGQKDPTPGAWWGAPPKPLWEADAPQSDPALFGTPAVPIAPLPAQQPNSHLGTFGIFPAPVQTPSLNSPVGDADSENGPEPLVEPLPASGSDEPYDAGDYYAARKAGLSRQQALNSAINSYHNKSANSPTFQVASPAKIRRIGIPRDGTVEISTNSLTFTHAVPRVEKPEEHIRDLAESIQRNGYDLDKAIQVAQMPDATLIVLGGNHRLAAMRLLNQNSIPARIFGWSTLSDNQRKFYRERFPDVFGKY